MCLHYMPLLAAVSFWLAASPALRAEEESADASSSVRTATPFAPSVEALRAASSADQGELNPTMIRDPAFDQFVDLAPLSSALTKRDASHLTDIALALAEGERVLLRAHKAISAKAVFEVAIDVAVERREMESISRIKKAAESLHAPDLVSRAEAAARLTSNSRSRESEIRLSVLDTSPDSFATAKGLLEEIHRATVLKDSHALAEIASRIDAFEGIGNEQRAGLRELADDARSAIPKEPGKAQRALQRLAEASRSVSGPPVRMDVLVEGVAISPIQHYGKLYIPVPRLGIEYAIRVHNLGNRRILAVVSVDGLSVMNGEVATGYSNGYVLDPGQRYSIRGWRRGNAEVAAFTFTDPGKSYAGQTGRPERIGLIRLIAFEEKEWRPAITSPPGVWGGGVGGSYSAVPDRSSQGAGTGYGRAVEDHVRTVPFVRSDEKTYIAYIYNTVQELRLAGVPIPESAAENGRANFTPPPPGSRN
jgi:hypothetical protein